MANRKNRFTYIGWLRKSLLDLAQTGLLYDILTEIGITTKLQILLMALFNKTMTTPKNIRHIGMRITVEPFFLSVV